MTREPEESEREVEDVCTALTGFKMTRTLSPRRELQSPVKFQDLILNTVLHSTVPVPTRFLATNSAPWRNCLRSPRCFHFTMLVSHVTPLLKEKNSVQWHLLKLGKENFTQNQHKQCIYECGHGGRQKERLRSSSAAWDRVAAVGDGKSHPMQGDWLN